MAFNLRSLATNAGNFLSRVWNGKDPQNQPQQGLKALITNGAQQMGQMANNAYQASKPAVQGAVKSMATTVANTVQQKAPIVKQNLGSTFTLGKENLRGVVQNYIRNQNTIIDPRANKQIQIDREKYGVPNTGNITSTKIKVGGLNQKPVQKTTISVTPTKTPTTPTPTPMEKYSFSPSGIKVNDAVNKAIQFAFGDISGEAHNVLSRKENGKLVGENTGYKFGADIDIPNRIDPKTGKWSNTAPIMKVKNAVTGEMMDSVDRGLFRINNGTFYDYMKRYPDAMQRNGITKWDDMLDPEKNALMARLIYNRQGWGAWYAAPQEYRTKKTGKKSK